MTRGHQMALLMVDALLSAVPTELVRAVSAHHIDRFSRPLDILVAVRALVCHSVASACAGADGVPVLEAVTAEGVAVVTDDQVRSGDDLFFTYVLCAELAVDLDGGGSAGGFKAGSVGGELLVGKE